MRPSRAAVVAAFAALYVFWGSTYLGSKLAMASFPPYLLGGVRFIAAGLDGLYEGVGSSSAKDKHEKHNMQR